jgi:hypothetical protein
MIIKMKSRYALSSLALLSIIGANTAAAATTSSKGGMMQTTTSDNRSDELPMLAKGVQELGLSGRLNWEDDTVYAFDISYGRFLTPNWLLGGEAGISGVDGDNDYRGGLFVEYNFLTNTQWVPFIRGTGSYVHPNEGDDAGLFDIDAGVKYFFRSNLAVSLSIGGGWTTDGDSNFEKQVNLGLRFYFN